jgi:D-hexose-6-phosphate mutarotase
MMMDEMRYAAAQQQTNNRKTVDREFSEATDRIYEKYGNDLAAFCQDVKKSITVEKSAERKPRKAGNPD